MIDPVTVRRRLRKLDALLQQLEELRDVPREDFLADGISQAAAAWLLQTAIQVVLDIGAHLLSERGVVDWEEYRQIPGGLAKQGILPESLAGRLESAAGLRNILVHMYLEIDPGRLYDTLQHDLDALIRRVHAGCAGQVRPPLPTSC